MATERPASNSGLKGIRTMGKNVLNHVSRNTDLAVYVAVFTATAHCCMGLLFIAGFQVYVVLETFVRPLMWAVLTGTCLFPFKTFLSGLVKGWLSGMRDTSTPILVALAMTPLSLLDRGLDYVGAEIVDFFREHGKKFAYTITAVIAYFIMYFWLTPLLSFLAPVIEFVFQITTVLSTNMIWLIVIPYAIALHLFWKSGYRRYLLYAALPLWILAALYFYNVLGDLAVPIYLVLAVQVVLGYSDEKVAVAKDALQSRINSGRQSRRQSFFNGIATQFPLSRQNTTFPSTRQTLHSCVEEGENETTDDQNIGIENQNTLPGLLEGSTTEEDTDSVMESMESHESLITRLGNHSRSMGIILQQSYRNMADVLTDDSATTCPVENNIADAAALLSSLNEMAVSGNLGEGTRYLMYIFWTFVFLEVLMSYYVIPLIFLPVTYRVVKIVFRKQKVAAKLMALLEPAKLWIIQWSDDRKEIVKPNLLVKVLTYAKSGDRKVLTIIESVTDETVSAILICLMFVFAAVVGVIGTMQIEQETSFLVTITGKMFDDAVRNNPELYDWLPDTEEFKEHFHMAYIYGRDFALKTMRSTLSDTNETRVTEIEQELSAIADQFYHHYIHKNTTSLVDYSSPDKGLGSLLGVTLGDPVNWLSPAANGTNPLLALWSNSTDLLSGATLTDTLMMAAKYLDISRIQLFMKAHIETFMSVFESAWQIIKGNLSLISSLLVTIISVTFTYFSAFLNLILCAVVYLTGLFYLLASSGNRYRPIELIRSTGKYISGAETFAEIVEDTISGIFAVSVKIGTFYGFYTWVLLSFTGMYVRFIPSILAALFAVCPLVPTYAVVLPAALNMWLRGDYITFVILLIGAYLPKLFVDAAIYGDLKTTNPYMFGLSVAGGLVSMGLEGAVFGPLMLCFLTIVMESCKKVIQSRFLDTTVVDDAEDLCDDGDDKSRRCSTGPEQK